MLRASARLCHRSSLLSGRLVDSLARARRPRPPRRRQRRCRCAAGDRRARSPRDRWRVDGPQHAERTNGQIERIACVVDGDAFRRHPAECHVRSTDAEGPKHDLVERFDRSDAALARRSRRRSHARRTVRCDDDVVLPRAHRRAAPPPRPTPRPAARTRSAGQRRRPPPRATTGANDVMASATPGVRATRTTPLPSARTPAAIGGRFGPRRTVSSRDEQHTHRTPVLDRPARAPRPSRATRPCRRRHRRWRAATPARRPARTMTRRSRGTPARPIDVRSVAAQSPSGSGDRVAAATVVRRPCTLAAPRVPRPSVSATDHPPRPSGTATSASGGRGVVGEAAAAEGDVRADALR